MIKSDDLRAMIRYSYGYADRRGFFGSPSPTSDQAMREMGKQAEQSRNGREGPQETNPHWTRKRHDHWVRPR